MRLEGRVNGQPHDNAARVSALAGIIVGLYLLLGVVYSVVIPLFESPDELTHYPYVQHLATGGGLPVQRPEAPQRWAQEGSQPPLYYALTAALTRWVDTSDLDRVVAVNPHARIGLPGAEDNLNAALHGAEERFPWRGTALSVHLTRLFSVLLGAGTVWCTYRLGRLLAPGRPAVALGAMAANAFLPQFLFISASVNNDNLVTLLCSAGVLLLAHIALGRGSRPAPLLLGALIGLAALAKLSGLGLLALAPVGLAMREWRRLRAEHGSRWPRGAVWGAVGRVAHDGALVLVMATAVAGWWYWRNWRLYGDPLGTSMMVAFMGRRTSLPSWREALGEFRGLRMSYWGLFGWFNVLMRPGWLYTLFDALMGASLVGLVVGAWRAGRATIRRRGAGVVLLALWVVIIGLALLRWTLTTPASQGRLLFPAVGALSLLLSLGVVGWLPRRAGQAALAGVGAVLLGAALAAPLTSIHPAYRLAQLGSPSDVPASAQPLEVTFGDAAQLLAVEVLQESVEPGEELVVQLYWLALKPTDRDYTFYVHLVGGGGAVVGQRDSFPGGGLAPTSRWSAGQVVCDSLVVPITARAEGPVALQVVVGMYDHETMAPLPAVDPAGNPVAHVVATRVRLAGSGRVHVPQYLLDVNLGDRVRLRGYDLPVGPQAPGVDVPLTLYWEVLEPLGQDYTVFVHLVTGDGETVAWGDGPPLAGAYPTSLWARGEVLADERRLRLTDDVPMRLYTLRVGLYELASGQRLPVIAATGEPMGDAVALTDLRVGECPAGAETDHLTRQVDGLY